MAMFLKCILLCLFAVVIFAKGMFTSTLLYWSMYILMFILVPLWWVAEYWISKEKAACVLKKIPQCSFFVGMVPANTNDDLIRGRLCLVDEELKLVVKNGGRSSVIWQEKLKNIKSSGTGKVAGIRKGFTLYTKNSDVSFVTSKADEIIEAIIK